MDLQKLAVKFFVEQPNTIPLTEFIEVFHGWMQASDGEYHDIADYSHMHAGPGIVLIANDANLSIDETENRRGLLLTGKANLAGSNQHKLSTTIRAALAHCQKLEKEPKLRGRLCFALDEVMIAVNDRSIGANSDLIFEQLKKEIDPVAREFFSGAEIAYGRDRDPRQRLHAKLKAVAALDVRRILAPVPADQASMCRGQ